MKVSGLIQKTITCILLVMIHYSLIAQNKNSDSATKQTFQNPILSGFNPDPSICKVGDDYYLVTSSFVWFPGIPIYHSKDLVNWELIGHGITRPGQVNFDGVKDRNGIWAVTIRYHDGLFYLITTASTCGGNFYITAKNPAGPWSDPVWLKNAPGIDTSLMWDDNGKCYYSGNIWGFEGAKSGQCAVWSQELDVKNKALVGERKFMSFGHANNAANTEAPHVYKIGQKYLLVTAEGGTDMYHAVTVHHGDSVLGTFKSDKINPVLTHRQLGKDYPIQAVGHADLVQTQNGDWWAVVLGKRVFDGEVPLSRETFLCKVDFENGTPIFNSGNGKVLPEQQRPDLPWSPVAVDLARDEFSNDSLSLKWYTIRTPHSTFYKLEKSKLSLQLSPVVVDSLQHSSILVQKLKHIQSTITTKMNFSTSRSNEQAGLIIYRTNDSYYQLMKEKSRIVLIRKSEGKKDMIAEAPYTNAEVYLRAELNRLNIQFSFGDSMTNQINIGGVQSLKPLCESALNKFNGPGIGVYSTSNGKKSNNRALFDWFEYQHEN
jgi:Beta-xylosidase